MGDVIHLHSARRGPGNAPTAIFLARLITAGAPAALRKLRTNLWMERPNERDGRYAVVGTQLLHLVGWSTCQITVDLMNRTLDTYFANELGESLQLRNWPYDVSSWPSVELSDTPSLWHLSPDLQQEVVNDAG